MMQMKVKGWIWPTSKATPAFEVDEVVEIEDERLLGKEVNVRLRFPVRPSGEIVILDASLPFLRQNPPNEDSTCAGVFTMDLHTHYGSAKPPKK